MARKRFWFAVAPTMYAVRRNRRERIGASFKSAAHVNCNATTASTKYFVKGSGPQSLVTWNKVSYGKGVMLKSLDTSGCALIMACLRVL